MTRIQKFIFLLLFFTATFNTFAQKTLSNSEIEDYLNSLQKADIITEFGKDALLKGFKEKGNLIPNNRFQQNNIKIPDSLFKSRAIILGVLGVFEIMRNVGSAADELVKYKEISEKLMGEKMLFKTEIETDFSPTKPETFIGIEFGIKNAKKNYQELANTFAEIGLIDKKVLEEAQQWLKRDKVILLKDFSFFIYLARQTWYYDNYESLKKEQLKLIDSLQVVRLLDESDARNLKNSYKPFELKNRIEILSKCKNSFLIPVETGNFTRAELYEELFKNIQKNILPEIKFTDFVISETKKKEDEENAFPNPNARLNNFFKNKNSFALSLKINGLAYKQTANTEFGFVKKLKAEIPPNVHIDSTLIDSYLKVFSAFLGFTSLDIRNINDYLTDIHSNKRVFILGNDYNPLNPTQSDKKVVILMDSVQYNLFAKKDFMMLISKEFLKSNEFESNKSRDSLKKFTQNLQEAEILSNFSLDTLDKKIVEFRFNNNYPQNIFEASGNPQKAFLRIFNDIISKNLTNATFKEFITELSRISRNHFKPEKIYDNIEIEVEKGNKKDRTFKYGFRLNGKTYEETKVVKKSEEENDGIIPTSKDWLALVRKAIIENEIDADFYSLGTFGLSDLIFLTKTQKDFLDSRYPDIFGVKKQANNEVFENYQRTISNYSAEKFADSLKAKNLLSKEAYEKLKKEVDLTKSKQPSEVLKYSDDVFVVDLNDFQAKNNQEFYSEITNKIQKQILKDAQLKDLKVEVIDTTNEAQEYMVSAQIGGFSYKQKLYVSLENEVKKALDSLKNNTSEYYPSIGENQFKIINDYLNDINHPKRMVIVCDYRSPMLSFVFFDSTQAHLVQETLPNNYVDFEMYNQENSRAKLTEKIQELINIGLIKNINIDSLISNFRDETRPFHFIFEQFPQKLTKSLYNYTDELSDDKLYSTLIEKLSGISDGKFLPTEIKDNYKKIRKKKISTDREFKFGFTFNGKQYEDIQLIRKKSENINDENGYSAGFFFVDDDLVLNTINNALDENSIDGKFHKLSFEDTDYEDFRDYYIYLTGRQYRFLKEKYPEIFSEYYNEKNLEIDGIEEKDK